MLGGEKTMWWDKTSAISTAIGSLIAAAAFVFGVYQFWQTQRGTRENLKRQKELLEGEREAKAVDLLLKFNELNAELGAKPLDAKDVAQFWKYNGTVSLIEALHKLMGGRGSSEWDTTIRW